MAKRTIKRTTADRKTSYATARKTDFFSQIKWGESYTSLILGAIVVIIGLVLVFSFLKSRSLLNQQTTSTNTETSEQSANVKPKNYTVKSGDYLWSISEKIYGSGYNWVDIANANKLSEQSVITAGTVLVIPDVKAKQVTVIEQKTVDAQAQTANPIQGDTYTVVKGDDLWQVAVRAYGDGYKWVQIAKANNLVNPNVIHPGNKFKLPR